MENDVHVQHYLDVIKRRKSHFIIPAGENGLDRLAAAGGEFEGSGPAEGADRDA